jgi:hypothetical protein
MGLIGVVDAKVMLKSLYFAGLSGQGNFNDGWPVFILDRLKLYLF